MTTELPPASTESASTPSVPRRSGWRRVWVALFGALSWQPPRWLKGCVQGARRHPLWALLVLLLVAATAAGGWWGYQWYQHRPKPIEPPKVAVTLTPPAVTDYTQDPIKVSPLVVDFSASVAPIALVDKPASAGIALDPPVPGQWLWQGDQSLVFTPAKDWPVGQRIRLSLTPGVATAAGVRLAETNRSFSTEPMAASLQSAAFYQDPQDPLKKSVIFAVQFPYPVDAASFERAVTLRALRPDAKQPGVFVPGDKEPFTVTFDPRHLTAFVHSAPLSLAPEARKLRLDLAKGVLSTRGGAGTTAPLSAEAEVPGLYSLGISQVGISLVDNARFEPQQTLIVNTTAPVEGTAVNRRVRAWLLPDTGPQGQKPYTWNPAMVGQAVLQRAPPVPLRLQPTERDRDSLQGFTFTAPPGRQLFVMIDKGLVGFGGYQLAKPQSYVLTVPPYPQTLKFLGQGALLPLAGDHRVSLVARNLPGVRLGIARLLPAQLQHLVSLNEGDFTHPRLRISPDHLVERFTETQSLPNTDPSKAAYAGFDLSPYLGQGSSRKRGVFLLTLRPWNPADPTTPAEEAGNDPFDVNSYADGTPGDSRLIVVTDLGLLSKKSLDGSRDVFVQSLSSGQPVPGAVVMVVAENGKTLLGGTTDDQGHVHFPTLNGFVRENRPVMLTVATADGQDFSFLPIGSSDRQLNFSRFDVGGAPNEASPTALSAYLFSDRGLYRPGETLHIGMIVRAADWAHRVTGLPLRLELVDPRGMTVTRQKVSPDQTGFMDWDYTPADTAPTGSWTVNLYLIRPHDDEVLLGSTTVQVKEFEPDQTRVTARLSPAMTAGWIKPNALQAVIDAHTLYGTPAASRRVTATLTLRPAFPAFAAWKDYQFYDPQHAKEGYTETLQEQTTNDQGTADFPLDLSSFAPATYALRFYAQVFEPGSGRNVAAAATALVSSADYLIGLKTDGALDFIPRDTARSVRLIAVDPSLQSIAVPGLQAVILSRQYVSVLTRQDSGAYQYESKLKESVVSRVPLALAAGGTDFALPTTQPGRFALVIEAANGTPLNRVDFTVAGDANVSRSLERNAELQLALDKKDYAPGDRIAVAIRAPYAGSGLITIERDKVYAYAWFHSETASSVQYITVPKGFEGNGYVTVQFLRDPASPEIYMSPLSYGVMPFSVDVGAHREAVTVSAPALIKPGQTVNMTVHTADPAQVALFAVDQGILQVANYQLEDPLDYFYRKRMLQVSSSQILDLLLPSFTQLTAVSRTGGDADAQGQQQLNPFKRKHEAPVAYWSGIVPVNGDRTFSYTVPDSFNGALKVMVVAVTPEKIGIAQTDTTVRGDFVLSPNLPAAVAPGDAFTASVSVTNNLAPDPQSPEATQPIRVALDAGAGFTVTGNAVQSLALAPGKSGLVQFNLTAGAQLGAVPLRFTASLGDKTATRQMSVSIRPAVPFQTAVQVGRILPGQQATLSPLREVFPELGERQAALSYLPLVLMRGLEAYLTHYGNYCSEQIISAATPALIAAARPEFAESAAAAARAPASLAQALATLRTRQNSEGGFGLWAATPDADPFVSVYALSFMLQARQAGVRVPADMLDHGLAYLSALAADDSSDTLAGLRARAFAIYLLTASGQVTTNLIAAVQQALETQYPAVWKTDLAAVYLAGAYRLLQQDQIANQMIAAPWAALSQARPASAPWVYADYNDPLITQAQTLWMVEQQFPALAAKLPPAVVERLAQAIGQNRFNTLSAALLLQALANLPQGQVPTSGLSMAQQLGSGSDAFTPFGQTQGALVLGHLAPTAQALRFSVADSAPAPAWYSLVVSGYDRHPPQKAVKQGLEVWREYTDDAGKPVTQVALGQALTVTVRLRALGQASVGDVAIVDILPGGFEVVNNPPAADPATDASAPDDSAGNGSGDASAGDATEAGDAGFVDTLAQPGSDMAVSYVEPREDRVLIYATATDGVQQYRYRIRAMTAGRFIEPPIYAESMYDREIHALTPGGGALTVTEPPAETPVRVTTVPAPADPAVGAAPPSGQ
ncbi:alpha-2-macroglobulin [Halothiobacillus sp. DCM-1]|uniref:alpha-2-macroglobulin n=1 Tax=Halothiobacillus sp. DCM-1 TaxID=3112558 RepID=UPI003243573C